MMLRFDCPHCGKRLKADTALAGQQTRCSGCGGVVEVPRWQGTRSLAPAAGAASKDQENQKTARSNRHSHAPIIPPSHKHDEDLIDMTAMVDIVFFLLIFFLVTSMQALESVMDLPSPQAKAGGASKVQSVAELENDPEFINVRIEDDDSVWVEDDQVFGEQELRVRLRRAKDEAESIRGVLVNGSADASHGAAVMVFDACMAVGLEDIRLNIRESSEGPAG